jgi:hypothetical protein
MIVMAAAMTSSGAHSMQATPSGHPLLNSELFEAISVPAPSCVPACWNRTIR